MQTQRSPYNRKPLARPIALRLAPGATLVIACGPDFPAQLLDDRRGTLLSTPGNSFFYEATRLAKSNDKLAGAEPRPAADDVARTHLGCPMGRVRGEDQAGEVVGAIRMAIS
mgnify:CR=1 FL=1